MKICDRELYSNEFLNLGTCIVGMGGDNHGIFVGRRFGTTSLDVLWDCAAPRFLRGVRTIRKTIRPAGEPTRTRSSRRRCARTRSNGEKAMTRIALGMLALVLVATTGTAQDVLPKPQSPFKGK